MNIVLLFVFMYIDCLFIWRWLVVLFLWIVGCLIGVDYDILTE